MPNLMGISAEELDAVKKRIVMRGMSTTALRLALGFPKKENDWGKGGKQLIFSEGFLVYVNEDNKVADWQILDSERRLLNSQMKCLALWIRGLSAKCLPHFARSGFHFQKVPMERRNFQT